MERLPSDIYVEVTKHLSYVSLATLAKTCSQLNKFTKSDSIWKYQCIKDAVFIPKSRTKTHFELFRRVKLVPIYYQDQNGGVECVPFANVKISDLKMDNTSLRFATRLFTDSFLCIVDKKNKYLWSICVVRNKIYHCQHYTVESKINKKVGCEPLSILWFTRNTSKAIKNLICGVIRCNFSETSDVQLYYGQQFKLCATRRLLNLVEPSECQGLTILNGLNIILSASPRFKYSLECLIKDGNTILFCNTFFLRLKPQFQIAYMSLNNKVKFKTVVA